MTTSDHTAYNQKWSKNAIESLSQFKMNIIVIDEIYNSIFELNSNVGFINNSKLIYSILNENQ